MVVHMAVYDSLLITDEVDISDDHDVLTMKVSLLLGFWCDFCGFPLDSSSLRCLGVLHCL
jgi:hypothetical protein